MGKQATKKLAALVKEELRNGVPVATIKNVLSRKGYSNTEIEKVFLMAAKKKEKSLTLRYVVVLIILVAAVLVVSAADLKKFDGVWGQRHENPPLPPETFCSVDSDCSLILCTQVLGQDTPRCDLSTGACYCGSSELGKYFFIGDPSELPYTFPDPGGEGIAISDRRTLPVICNTDDNVFCSDPIMDSFFASNSQMGIERYEQWIYMILENAEGSAIAIKDIEVTSSNAEACYYVDTKDLTMEPNTKTGRIAFLCINPTSPSSLDETVTITYDVYGEGKFSVITLRTQ